LLISAGRGVLGATAAVRSSGLMAGISRDPHDDAVVVVCNSAQWPPSADLEDPRCDIPEGCFRRGIFNYSFLFLKRHFFLELLTHPSFHLKNKINGSTKSLQCTDRKYRPA
jgi:hypothetical protein